jgi:cyanophycin synthetase
VLNVQPDHLGLKGIDTIEDLASVKSVVVESVRRDGCSVLNADDPLTVDMARHAGGRIGYFSLRGDAMPEMLLAHIKAGRLAVVLEPGPDGGVIVLHDDARRLPIMSAAEIPATLGGQALFNVANALAAVAMAYAAGITPPAIRGALQSFASTFEQNPGRLNTHDKDGVRIIVDYAHNPAGLSALCDLVGRLRPRHRRIIGMVGCPGDRRDEDLREMGRIAASAFDEIVLRERPETRGRPDGEVMRLMAEGTLDAGFPAEHIHSLPEEHDALELCLAMARPGDLVVLTPSALEAAWARVQRFSPAREPAEA